MAVTVEWTEELTFRASGSSGQPVALDANPSLGGRNQGTSPMELLLIALGGCTGMDVVSILRKMRQEVTAYRVQVDGTRQTEHPRIYTEIDVRHIVTGRRLSPDMVQRAVDLSATRYCPASAMLSKAAQVRHHVQLIEDNS